MNCILWDASFELMKNLAPSDPGKLQCFYGTLQYYCYTLFGHRSHCPLHFDIRNLLL
jgi:hypothetical protein